jgi:hypothetical protein
MGSVLALLAAELLQFEPIGAARLLVGAVIPIAARRAFKPNVFPHDDTLLPVSRPHQPQLKFDPDI